MDSRRLIHKRYRDSRERRRQAGWMDGGRFSERARKKKTCWNRLSLRSRMNRLVRSAKQARRIACRRRSRMELEVPYK